MEDYKMIFKRGLDAGRQGQDYEAISYFKKVLALQIPKDWEMITCMNIGQAYYGIAQKGLSTKQKYSHLNEDEIKILENAFEYLDRAYELAERYPTSLDFPDYKQAIHHCNDSLTRVGMFLDSLGRVKNVLVKDEMGNMGLRMKLKQDIK